MNDEHTAYFLWLYNRIQHPKHEHRKLLRFLHSVEFRWHVPNDDNRIGDGKELRTKYCETHHILTSDETYDAGASVLEVLIALADRMDDQLYEPFVDSRSSIWFWEFLQNLGLAGFNDKKWYGKRSEGVTLEVLDTWMDRKYDPSGSGGIFPVYKPHQPDQTKVELWYQLMAYLGENY